MDKVGSQAKGKVDKAPSTSGKHRTRASRAAARGLAKQINGKSPKQWKNRL